MWAKTQNMPVAVEILSYQFNINTKVSPKRLLCWCQDLIFTWTVIYFQNSSTIITSLLWWMQLTFGCSYFFVILPLQDWSTMQISVRESENIKTQIRLFWAACVIKAAHKESVIKKALLRHQPSRVCMLFCVTWLKCLCLLRCTGICLLFN